MIVIALIVILRIISVVQILLNAAIPIKIGTPNLAVHLDLQKKNSAVYKFHIKLKILLLITYLNIKRRKYYD